MATTATTFVWYSLSTVGLKVSFALSQKYLWGRYYYYPHLMDERLRHKQIFSWSQWADIWTKSTGLPWIRKWQCTQVFLPGRSHRQRNLMGYSLWGHKELDTTVGNLISGSSAFSKTSLNIRKFTQKILRRDGKNTQKNCTKKIFGEEPRWRRSRTGRTLSPPQIHQKSI